MSEQDASFSSWAVVEVLGRKQFAGEAIELVNEKLRSDGYTVDGAGISW